ncbi:hypothetical protein GXM_08020 [Nostoc sphaeroides CCNUC1]|uniref:Uncharacterized protein n=1 Tax=Nostoc sphaeroides CCNUC1 TaxID=2653204 RepID=A0A5P8WEC8_9NOSO|nr:hypothetical protein GXM_08020 [Nostoc sphaeroides CCNUC1]
MVGDVDILIAGFCKARLLERCFDQEFKIAIAITAVTTPPTVARIEKFFGGGSKSEFILLEPYFPIVFTS